MIYRANTDAVRLHYSPVLRGGLLVVETSEGDTFSFTMDTPLAEQFIKDVIDKKENEDVARRQA